MIQITLIREPPDARMQTTGKLRPAACHVALRLFVATVLAVAASAAAVRKVGQAVRRITVPAHHPYPAE
ncbi:hypothetical protein FGU65_04660 [Methanoculleus sp. FWC-SCC1]|uniref:Uncharacterized protein n=1 Tax=Methanoculleus frigidifontis TaxID=2584085 RepID=A0ABT8M8D6_9EURY|nr:hypothetical protein [Methanoculleus sp. FWC-SCC1]MDN7024186.1 hypothetical protein [Methanoculleus sp. FWC-SCC1]